MKIIFLDFDGVLNSTRSFITSKRGTPNGRWSTLDEMNIATIDPVSVGLVNDLAERTGAEFVISSSHRKYFMKHNEIDLPRLRQYFRDVGIEGNIIGATPRNYRPYSTRGDEIKEWLDGFLEPIEAYVILDDDSDMLDNQLTKFVKTCSENGFLFEHYLKAMEILGAETKDIMLNPRRT
jgi:hypothetical protein